MTCLAWLFLPVCGTLKALGSAPRAFFRGGLNSTEPRLFGCRVYELCWEGCGDPSKENAANPLKGVGTFWATCFGGDRGAGSGNPALNENMVLGYVLWKTIYRAYKPFAEPADDDAGI